jgi:hypothetical protein
MLHDTPSTSQLDPDVPRQTIVFALETLNVPLHFLRTYRHSKMRIFCWLEEYGSDYTLTQLRIPEE